MGILNAENAAVYDGDVLLVFGGAWKDPLACRLVEYWSSDVKGTFRRWMRIFSEDIVLRDFKNAVVAQSWHRF